MKNAWLHRVLSTASIITLIVVAWMLPSKLQEILTQVEYSGLVSQVNVLIGVLVILAIVLYILSLQRPVREIVKEKIVEKTVTVSKEEDEKKESEEDDLDQKEIEKIAQRMLPDTKKLKTHEEYTEKLLSNLSKEFEVVQGVAFVKSNADKAFYPSGRYAYFLDEPPKSFKEGEGIPGQVAKNKKMIVIDDIPEGYIKVLSGLGDAQPRYLMLVPVLNKNTCIAVLEMAAFKKISKKVEATVEKLAALSADKIVEFNKA